MGRERIERKQLLRRLPKVDLVLARADVVGLGLPRSVARAAVRRAVQQRRDAILAGESEVVEVELPEIERMARELMRPSLRRVINATGVVVHTNLGRAPLAREVAARVAELAAHYSNLEYDLGERARGSRHAHLAELLRELTGAEDAVVVNNNAGAVMLALAATAEGREVVVSRGELIEIGGSFRIPDVMRLSGARLVEVGTTNKTHRRDYAGALSDQTALLLKVHRSNFAIVGFTVEVELPELVELARESGVATMVDLGSGALLEAEALAAAGLPPEPSVRATVATGADLVTFSGDKLLGGPQAGVIAGAAAAVARCRTHPLMRALRPDKMTLAGLEATLALYRDGRAGEVPVVAMLSAPVEQLRARAQALAARLGAPAATEPNDRSAGEARWSLGWLELAVEPCRSAVGGGALPTAELPSFALVLRPSAPGHPGCTAPAIERRLRAPADPAATPIVGRIADDAVVLDLRTVADDELDAVAKAIRSL